MDGEKRKLSFPVKKPMVEIKIEPEKEVPAKRLNTDPHEPPARQQHDPPARKQALPALLAFFQLVGGYAVRSAAAASTAAAASPHRHGSAPCWLGMGSNRGLL